MNKNIKIAKQILKVAKQMLAYNNDIKTDFMICGYRQDRDKFKATIAIENRCFMSNYGYEQIKKSVKEVNSILKKIERIANRLGCKKKGFRQNGTLNAVWYEVEDQSKASEFVETVAKIKPNFIVNKLK